jgi:hypothetical protein
VRHVHDELAVVLPDLQELLLQNEPGLGIERAERLIEQQDLRIGDEGAGDAHALSHADGQLVRPVMEESLQADLDDEVPGLLFRLGAGHVLQTQPEGHVGEDVVPGEEAVVLEDQGRPEFRSLRRRSVEHDLPGSGLHQSGDDLEQRGLPAAARPHDADKLRASQGESHAGQRRRACLPASVLLGEAVGEEAHRAADAALRVAAST